MASRCKSSADNSGTCFCFADLEDFAAEPDLAAVDWAAVPDLAAVDWAKVPFVVTNMMTALSERAKVISVMAEIYDRLILETGV